MDNISNNYNCNIICNLQWHLFKQKIFDFREPKQNSAWTNSSIYEFKTKNHPLSLQKCIDIA